MNIKACVLDLDGTLLNSRKKVADRSMRILANAFEAGVKLIIATARPPRTVKCLLPDDLHSKCSFIYYNGALVHSPELTYYSHQSIASELSKELIEYCVSQDPDIDLSLEVEDRWYSLREYDGKVLDQVGGKPEVKSISELAEYRPTKIIFAGSKRSDRLLQMYGSELSILVTDRGTLTQIAHKDASKEAGLVKLCERFGILLEETICFGDDMNDIGLFRTCGMSVAMENGIDELKQIATEITTSNDDDGVARVLERLLPPI